MTYTERKNKRGGNEASLDGGQTWRKLLPILFTADNAQKCFDGVKTQTRRIIKKASLKFKNADMPFAMHWPAECYFDGKTFTPDLLEAAKLARYRVGDILYCKEPWRTHESMDGIKPTCLADHVQIQFEGWAGYRFWAGKDNGKLRPARFMPLRFSRPARYEITAVRCERVIDISEDDAKAEGCFGWLADMDAPPPPDHDPVQHFRLLWNSIHGKGAFDRGDWVFAYTFRRVN